MSKGKNLIESMMLGIKKYLPDMANYAKSAFGGSVTNIVKNPMIPFFVPEKQKTFNKPQRKWHGTIGIIGLDPTKVVKLNKDIIEYGNSVGLTDDQEFPEIMSIGIRSNRAAHLEDQAKLCLDIGCDVVVVAGDTGNSSESVLRKGLEVAVHPLPLLSSHKQDFKDLAKKAFDYACNVENPRRPDLLYLEDGSDFRSAEERVGINIAADTRSREKRMKEREDDSAGYPFLRNTMFGGIIGGAGPLASSDLCEKLARTSIPFIHYSVNSAPGKYRYEMHQGPSFVPHYRNAVKLFEDLGAEFLAVPCNTAHKRIGEFCNEESLKKVVDIRKSALEANENAEGFILLGTSITTGVGAPDGYMGTYEEMRKNHPSHGPFNIPSTKQQKIIMDAIYEVKAGKLDEAKSKIMKVVKEMREKHGHLPVILACTELPLANFEPLELVGLKFVDPAEALASKAEERVVNAKLLRAKSQVESVEKGKSESANLSFVKTGSDNLIEFRPSTDLKPAAASEKPPTAIGSVDVSRVVPEQKKESGI